MPETIADTLDKIKALLRETETQVESPAGEAVGMPPLPNPIEEFDKIRADIAVELVTSEQIETPPEPEIEIPVPVGAIVDNNAAVEANLDMRLGGMQGQIASIQAELERITGIITILETKLNGVESVVSTATVIPSQIGGGAPTTSELISRLGERI